MKKEKQYKISISPKFHDAFRQHLAFLALKSKSAALKLHNAVYKAITDLSVYPERYPVFTQHSLSHEYRKMFIPNWFMIIYEVQEDTVWVDYILDCRKDNKRLLAQKDS